MGVKEKIGNFKENCKEVGQIWKLRCLLDQGQNVVIKTFGENSEFYHVDSHGFIDCSKVNETINGLNYSKGSRVDVIVDSDDEYVGFVSLRKHK
jgi:hypothetical protein